ncbi:hypothetical protein D3C80_1983980 [compost metagenome]
MAEAGLERGGNDPFHLRVGHAEDAEAQGWNGGAVSGDGLHLKNSSLKAPEGRREK